jgi:hypothetical protein
MCFANEKYYKTIDRVRGTVLKEKQTDNKRYGGWKK